MCRSLLDIKSAGSRDETKKTVFDYVAKETLNQIQWPQKKRSEGYSDDCFDIADAYVLAKAGLIENTVDSIMHYYNVTETNRLLSQSPFFADFVKIHIVHFIKKYTDDASIQNIDSLSSKLVEVFFSNST